MEHLKELAKNTINNKIEWININEKYGRKYIDFESFYETVFKGIKYYIQYTEGDGFCLSNKNESTKFDNELVEYLYEYIFNKDNIKHILGEK